MSGFCNHSSQYMLHFRLLLVNHKKTKSFYLSNKKAHREYINDAYVLNAALNGIAIIT
ncbi:hypothetical protein HanXRQr2_Chr13g0619501 [Helianthus annuus]|uniref:Uncharacterized protein n=1 Tax=Helianthus annuus TaxID=4232 RepID=A0A9K3HEC2_HELAN|nr:hypothetical protein HanXRQr2_Chr13g0619501 [Helianthus annuus]KAJ0851667.1 hypothetical protein HanPSC8_Chr13g0594701 [Helianthus annuus]